MNERAAILPEHLQGDPASKIVVQAPSPLTQARDAALLQAFVQRQAQEAFAALVARHIPLVYSVALRQVRDHHLAEDVTQAVFLLLSQKARTMPERINLPAWLFRVTRYTAGRALRTNVRRQFHERAAGHAAIAAQAAGSATAGLWAEVAPFLDGAVAALGETDRQAVLLRFYGKQPLREVGAALGVSEDAAQKRVDRALEKLRALLGRKRVAAAGAALALLLMAHGAEAAPPALAANTALLATQSAATSLKVAALAKGASQMLLLAKLKVAALYVAAVLVLAGGAVGGYQVIAAGPAPPPPAVVSPSSPAPNSPAALAGPPVTPAAPDLDNLALAPPAPAPAVGTTTIVGPRPELDALVKLTFALRDKAGRPWVAQMAAGGAIPVSVPVWHWEPAQGTGYLVGVYFTDTQHAARDKPLQIFIWLLKDYDGRPLVDTSTWENGAPRDFGRWRGMRVLLHGDGHFNGWPNYEADIRAALQESEAGGPLVFPGGSVLFPGGPVVTPTTAPAP